MKIKRRFLWQRYLLVGLIGGVTMLLPWVMGMNLVTGAEYLEVLQVACENRDGGREAREIEARAEGAMVLLEDTYFSEINDYLSCDITVKNQNTVPIVANLERFSTLTNDIVNYELKAEENYLAPGESEIFHLVISYARPVEKRTVMANTVAIEFQRVAPRTPDTGEVMSGDTIEVNPYVKIYGSGWMVVVGIMAIVMIVLLMVLRRECFYKILGASVMTMAFLVVAPCVRATLGMNVMIVNQIVISKPSVTLTVDRTELVETEEWKIRVNYEDKTRLVGAPKYLLTHFPDAVGANSPKWRSAKNLDMNTQEVRFADETLDAGTYYFHLLTPYNNGEIESVSERVHVRVDEATRIRDLNNLTAEVGKTRQPVVRDNNLKLDFFQPWIYAGQPVMLIEKDLMLLKRAGYDGVIIQFAMEVGSDEYNQIYPKASYYATPTYPETIQGDTLGDLLKAAHFVGMDVYVGGVYSYDWWEAEKMNDRVWHENYADFTVQIMQELDSLYGDDECFKGWYWTNEMYTTSEKLDELWVPHLATVTSYLNSMAERKPFIVAPFISSFIMVDEEMVRREWSNIIEGVDFQPGDTIVFQDGFGNTEYPVEEIFNFLAIVRDIVKAKNPAINFSLDLETFLGTSSVSGVASVERFVAQKTTASYLADTYYSFSYLHYYSPYQVNLFTMEKNDPRYDQNYRTTIGQNVANDTQFIVIETPVGGSVYTDIDGLDAPVPRGFHVSTNPDEDSIKEGLVIRDDYGNEFVYVPVFYGIQPNGYKYKNYEAYGVAYARYLDSGLGDIGITGVVEDSLPVGIESEFAQIEKYQGFYVGRYEASYEYEDGVSKTASRPVLDTKAKTDFYPAFASSANYNGQMMLNVNYETAKNFADKMANDYQYDSTVRTGLVNGREWDTIAKWMEVEDYTKYMPYDGRGWGNYLDSVNEAATGNYVSGELRGTGSNKAWKARNIYDFAGNLREWTSERTLSGQVVARSVAYDGDGAMHGGLNGGPSYNAVTDSYQWSDMGFRVVLYIM